MGGLVRASKDLDHQLLHGGFKGSDGQRFQGGMHPYSADLYLIFMLFKFVCAQT